MNSIPTGPQGLHYLSPAAPEFFPPWMQSDVTFSPTRMKPVPPPPDQSPQYKKMAPSPLGERTNLPPEHDASENLKKETTPVKAALSAQRQELEDQIRAVLGAAVSEKAVPGNSAANVPELPEISLENLPEDMPSIGSVSHETGECRRCNFFPNGHCLNGRSCQFCHFPHEKRKLSRRERRERRQERQQEEQENPGIAFSDVSSTTVTPTITPTAAGFTASSVSIVTPTATPTITPSAGAFTASSVSLLGYNNSEVGTPMISPTVTPTAGNYTGCPMQLLPAKVMCSSEAQTDDDMPPCVHCGAAMSSWERIEGQASSSSTVDPTPEGVSSSGDGQGPPTPEPDNDENDEDDEDTLPARRIAELGG
jgi:hypothetical protein